MSDFYKITRLSITRRPERKSEKSYLWKDHLRGFEKGKSAFVPGDAFNVNLLVDFNDSVREGVIFELNIHDYDKKVTDDVRVRWFAKVLDVCGYRVLSQFIGTEKKFWIHLLSDDVFSVGHGAREMKDSVIYCPPLPINIAYQKDMERFVNTAIQEECEGHPHLTPIYDIAKTTMHTPRFRVGQRLELLNYQKSTEIRVARVQATCGRRINVLVMKKDFPLSSLPDAEDDRQVYHSGAQYWIDEGSFFIFPVGFAAVNGYTLNAKADYIEHTRKIAEAIKNHEEPKYDLDDVKFSDLPKQSVDPELWSKLKKGQKFELIDPLAQQFKNLHVASILDFLTTDGYLIVGMDGPDALEDSFPIHINNAFMFPVGYAKEHDLELVEPDEFEGEFEWKKYLEEQGAEPLPLELFRPEPSEERLDKFQVGMRLEAADMCENHFICPATITSVHGRILNVNFDGWDEEFDELYDIENMAAEDKFESVLSTRYCKNSPLVKILSETNKATLWRQLWIWLAEAEQELELKQVTQTAIDEMKAQRDTFDWPFIRAEERKLKHDVMAHNHAFGKICPNAAGIIHLGATSCYVQDNADLIAFRDAIDHLLKRFATVIDRLAEFSLRNKEVVTVGRTHYQTASLVTVGKRGVLWAQELLMAFQTLAEFRNKMRFRGIKGATGTQDSFLTLFNGNEQKVELLDELVTAKAGFSRRFLITGQTYSRQQDSQLVFALSLLGAAAKKVCTDIRVLQAFGELLEPFEKDQIGSSAMPYKKNPMKSERCCALARKLINAPQEALTILADQGLERTLDDSAGRRMLIPDVLLTAEALLTTLQNIFEGLTVQTDNVKKIVEDEIAFLGLEKAMMMLTEEGVDRQQAHAVIRKTALEAKQLQATQKVDIRQTMADSFFDSVRDRVVKLVDNPINFTGRCVSQTESFISKELKPTISKYLDASAGNVQLDV